MDYLSSCYGVPGKGKPRGGGKSGGERQTIEIMILIVLG